MLTYLCVYADCKTGNEGQIKIGEGQMVEGEVRQQGTFVKRLVQLFNKQKTKQNVHTYGHNTVLVTEHNSSSKQEAQDDTYMNTIQLFNKDKMYT